MRVALGLASGLVPPEHPGPSIIRVWSRAWQRGKTRNADSITHPVLVVQAKIDLLPV
jgi:hypothetical protein